MSSCAISLSPLRHIPARAGSSRNRNPNRTNVSKSLPNKSTRNNLKKRISSEELSPLYGTAGNATTYTRLPPKDDAVGRPDHICHEIRLSDLGTPPVFVEESLDEFSGVSSSELEIVDEFVEDEFPDIGESFDEDEDGDSAVAFDGEEDFSEEKEKGVPAVMRCFDRTKIYVKAGDGGNGVVAFRREKYVPLGGPSGGDGGKGGNVYVEVDGSMNSLLPFRKSVHFRAGRGAHGQGKKQAGAKGEDVVVKVAPGTVLRDANTGVTLLELLWPGQRALLLPGGRGGRGNASFKSGTNKVPKIAERGEEGAEMYV